MSFLFCFLHDAQELSGSTARLARCCVSCMTIDHVGATVAIHFLPLCGGSMRGVFAFDSGVRVFDIDLEWES